MNDLLVIINQVQVIDLSSLSSLNLALLKYEPHFPLKVTDERLWVSSKEQR